MGNSFTNKNTDQAILNDLSRFHGFYNNVYRDPFIGGNAFIFVTKPLLFIDYMAPKKTDTKSRLAYMNMKEYLWSILRLSLSEASSLALVMDFPHILPCLWA